MWGEADDYGIFEWRPTRLKMRIAPCDAIDAAAIMDELKTAGFLHSFPSTGGDIGAIRNFCKYQRPKNPSKPTAEITPEIASIIGLSEEEGKRRGLNSADGGSPSPALPQNGEKSPQMEDGGCNIRQDGKAAPEAENSIEAEIEPAESAAPSPRKADKRGSRIPVDWKPEDVGREFARSAGIPERDIDRHAAEFVDYWSSVSGTKGVKLDWLATWRNRCRDIAERKGYRPVMGAPAGMSGSPVPVGWPDRLPPPDTCFSAWSRGSWPGAWGAAPGDPGCRVPSNIIAEWRTRMAKAA